MLKLHPSENEIKQLKQLHKDSDDLIKKLQETMLNFKIKDTETPYFKELTIFGISDDIYELYNLIVKVRNPHG